jgi:excisionase family DNA binding protein
MDTAPLAYSIGEVCRVLGIGKSSLYKSIKSGELPAKKRGHRTLILADDLRAFLQRLPAIPSQNND